VTIIAGVVCNEGTGSDRLLNFPHGNMGDSLCLPSTCGGMPCKTRALLKKGYEWHSCHLRVLTHCHRFNTCACQYCCSPAGIRHTSESCSTTSRRIYAVTDISSQHCIPVLMLQPVVAVLLQLCGQMVHSTV
jgi:hypothetical protein